MYHGTKFKFNLFTFWCKVSSVSWIIISDPRVEQIDEDDIERSLSTLLKSLLKSDDSFGTRSVPTEGTFEHDFMQKTVQFHIFGPSSLELNLEKRIRFQNDSSWKRCDTIGPSSWWTLRSHWCYIWTELWYSTVSNDWKRFNLFWRSLWHFTLW